MPEREKMIAVPDRTTRSQRLLGSQAARRARRALENSPLFRGRAKSLRIDESDGCLVVEGRLPSYYLKQMLQTLLREVEGVRQIENRVAVDWPIKR